MKSLGFPARHPSHLMSFLPPDDAAGGYNQLFRIALKSFQNAGPSIRPDTGAEVKDFFEDLALAYFAMGTLLGAKRELMVKSLRPSSA